MSPVIMPSAIFRKSAFLRLATPEALPPLFAISLCSSLVRSLSGIKFSLPSRTHLTFQSICILLINLLSIFRIKKDSPQAALF
nr:MAG TPA: hypothetical protein [Caudoviricetes sp.]